jgi:hypothetical protein
LIPEFDIAVMEHPQLRPPLPAEYYRRHAARVRQLASEATTSAVKEHLQDVAGQYERLAERVDVSGRPVEQESAEKGGR